MHDKFKKMYKSTHMIFFYVYCENFMVYYSFSERNSVSFIYFDLLSGLCSHYCVLLHPQCHLVYFTLCCLISEPEKNYFGEIENLINCLLFSPRLVLDLRASIDLLCTQAVDKPSESLKP